MNNFCPSLACRRQIARLRHRAMKGGAAAVLVELSATATNSLVDRAALACLRAEILYLDGREYESLNIFDSELEPLLPSLPSGARVELLENKSSVLVSAWRDEGTNLFYQLADRRALLDHPSRDYRRVVIAADAASRGEHYDALPEYWAELRQAYAGLSWRRRSFAHADFARECLALGWLTKAAYHIICAEQKTLEEQLAEALNRAKDAKAVSAVVRHGLLTSGLARHATCCIRIVTDVADLLPDSDIAVVIDRLAEWAGSSAESLTEYHRLETSWEALQELAPRLNADQAERLISLALGHPEYSPSRLRRTLLKTINAMLNRTRPEHAAVIAPRLVAPATEQKSDVDYAEALNALCHAVEHCADAEVRKSVGIQLFPPGQPVSDSYLMQIAPVFGWNTQDRAQFNQAALHAAAAVRKQVQRLAPGEEAIKIGGYGQISKRINDEILVVHMHGAKHWIDAILSNRQFLDTATADELAEALVETADNDDNTVVNRHALIGSLRMLVSHISELAAAKCAAKLRRVAAGVFAESKVAMSHEEATSVLNPFKLGQGDPADLQGIALVALADLSCRTPVAINSLRDEGLLAAAMSDPRPTIRAYAATTARGLPSLTPEEFNALILSATDPNPKTAAIALAAFRNPQRLKLKRPQVALLLTVLERAATRPEQAVRGVAAEVTNGLNDMKVEGKAKARRDALLIHLATDPAYSVRSELTTPRRRILGCKKRGPR